MAHHVVHNELADEVTRMRPAGRTLGVVLMVAGVLAVLAAYVVSPVDPDGHTRRFWFAYLFGLVPVIAVSVAALIFTLVNHLVRAGWITNVRRILETFALQTILVAVLVLPLIVLVMGKKGVVYSWARPGDTPVVTEEGEGNPEHKPAREAATQTGTPQAAPTLPNGRADLAGEAGTRGNQEQIKRDPSQAVAYPNEQVMPGWQRPFDELIAHKNHTWLNPAFWSLRVLFYVITLAGIAYYYWSSSVKQDATGDIDVSARLSYMAGPLVMAVGTILTFMAFDLYMSLDPHWFSTMYGVYFFASGTQAMWALMALFVLTLQWRGYLRGSITKEHRHDIGKFLWAFIFFFGYIAFDQYMLQWYANLPEETFFYDKRGYSQAHPNAYTPLVIAVVIGRFVVPFLGLVSRHVKRNRFGLGFWAAWLLFFGMVDAYVLVMPDYKWVDGGHLPPLGPTEFLAFFGLVGLWFGNVIRVLGNHELRAVRDPRAHESLALVNF